MMLDNYKREIQKIKNTIATYQAERQKLLDSEIYTEDYRQKKIGELRVNTFEQICNAFDTMTRKSKKDYEAAYKKKTPANLEEARYWATVVHQDLSSMNPDQIIATYKAVIKEGLPVKKSEFERIARNILSSKEELHGKLYEFEVIRKETMTPEEKEQAKAIRTVESLEDVINRCQDFATFNINKLEEGEDIITTGRLDYLDSPFTQLEKEIEEEFNPSPAPSFTERLAANFEANRKIVSESAAGTKSFSVGIGD